MKKPTPGYILPVVSDADRLCFQVMVPNDEAHIAAFMGQLAELGRWYAWQRDELHFGKDVAATWDGIALAVGVAYSNGEFGEDCGIMDCDAVVACLDGRIRTGINGLQFLGSGGIWTDIPNSEGDPRTSGVVPPPWITVPAGQTGNCLAAANILVAFKQLCELLGADSGHTYNQFYFINGLIRTQLGLAFSDLTPLLDAISNFNVVVEFITTATFRDVFTDIEYDIINCALSCNIDGDGTIPDENIDDIISYSETHNVSAVFDVFKAWVQLFGRNGLMLLETVGGVLDADCADCDCGWCYYSDFAAGDFSIWANVLGTYVPGSGVHVTNSGPYPYTVDLKLAPIPGLLSKVEFILDRPTGEGGSGWSIYYSPTVGFVAGPANVTGTDIVGGTVIMYPSQSELHIQVGNISVPSENIIKSVKIWGTGTPPFGASTC